MPTTLRRALAIGLLAAHAACSRQTENAAYRFPGCPGTPAPSGGSSIKAVISTESGMHGLWNPLVYSEVCDLAAWEGLFLKDEHIEAQVRSGRFVPIYIHEDGGPLFELRVGSQAAPATPTPDQVRWTTRTSQPYLFQSQGLLALSGIEQVHGGSANPDVRAVALPSGRWTITIRMLEPPRDAPGNNGMVPDFVVLVNPEPANPPSYRTSVETFGRDAK